MTLKEKYTPEKLKGIRASFDRDVQDWAKIKAERAKDIKCISTEKGPWPEEEWNARHVQGQERPCLHEDVLTPYANQVINQIEMNPMGIEAQPAGDGADEDSAQFLEGRIRQLEYEESGQYAYLAAAKCAVEGSYGFFKFESAWRGKFGQKVCIEAVLDPDTIVPGFAKKPDWSDMRQAWEIERMSHLEFKERWPKATIQDFAGLQNDAGQWIDDSTVQVAAWWHLQEDERELLRMANVTTKVGYDDVYADELTGELDEKKVLDRRIKKRRTVIKTILNGVEALDETEWIDPGDEENDVPPEIPIFVVTGRVKYEAGIRTIESLIRKGRVGQLLYDYCISQIQETMALAPRAGRLGPEGSFDTSTNWSPRANQAVREWKPVNDPETNAPLGPPILEQFDVQAIQFLELAKDSILRGIQNSIGMASTERKDRSAKSGKALDQLAQEMSVATAHYFGATRMAQERSYRALARILPVIDKELSEVITRDKSGNHTVGPVAYKGRHSIAVGTGKLYQTLQEKQEETSDQLMKIGDPNVLLAVLPGAIRMRGLGDDGKQLADMIEAMQPPQMQAARQNKGEISPQAQQAIQQAQQAAKALNAHAEELERQIIELEDEKKAKVLELANKKEIAEIEKEKAVEVATINASTKEDINSLVQQVAAIKHIADVLTERFKLDHAAEQAELGRAAQATQSDAERSHQADMANRQLAATQEQPLS